MTGNRNAPQGRAMGQKGKRADDRANDRRARLHYKQNSRFIQEAEAVRRCLADDEGGAR